MNKETIKDIGYYALYTLAIVLGVLMLIFYGSLFLSVDWFSNSGGSCVTDSEQCW